MKITLVYDASYRCPCCKNNFSSDDWREDAGVCVGCFSSFTICELCDTLTQSTGSVCDLCIEDMTHIQQETFGWEQA